MDRVTSEEDLSSVIGISIIIPVRNEEKFIESTLRSLLNQEYPPDKFEIIVIDGLSTDQTPVIVNSLISEYPNNHLKLVNNPRKLSSSARNLGVSHARFEYVLIVDGHVYVPNNKLLISASELALKSGAKVLGRPQPLNPPDIDDFQKHVAFSRESPLAHSTESYIYSNYEGFTSPISIGVMYRKAIFQEYEGFDETFDAAEDLEFNYRLELNGLKCFTSPRLAVKYYPRSTIPSLFKQMIRYGVGRAKFIRKHFERFTIELLIPPVFFLAVLLTIPACLISTFTRWLWVIGGMSYVLLVLGEGIRLQKKNDFGNFLRYASIIFTVHLGLGWGFIKGLITTLSPNKTNENIKTRESES